MQNLRAISSKDKKKLQKYLAVQFHSDFKLNYDVFISDKKKIYVVNSNIKNIYFDQLRIHSIGHYFGELCQEQIRLSFDAAKLVGETARKNVFVLNKKQAWQCMKGKDIENLDTDLTGFVVVKYKENFIGCGKIKEKKLLNYVPKERRHDFET